MISPADLSNNRILLVDDNPSIHEDVRKVLAPANPNTGIDAEAEALLFGPVAERHHQRFQIDSAYQGQEALAMVQNASEAGLPYALALVDVRMPPGWDGVETIEQLWKADPQLQIVICTAYSDYSWEEITQKLGMSDSLVILKKPFDNIELQQLAHALTTKWNLTQQARLQLADLDVLVLQRTQELRAANEKLKSEVEERSAAETALRRSEERFAKAFHASPIAMAILPLREEVFLDVNGAFLTMTQRSREEVVGHASCDLKVWGELLKNVKETIARQNVSSVRDIHCQVQTSKGDLREACAFVEVFELESAPFLLLILQDITDRTRLESQLRHAQKMEAIGQLAAGVAHDFNNILTVIQGHAQMRLLKPGLEKDVASSLKQVAHAADRATALTRQLLAYSRRQIMQLRPVRLDAIVRDMRDMLARLLPENIKLECTLDEASALADVSNIEQVVLNLAVNARDAMVAGGHLSIVTAMVQIESVDADRNPEARKGSFTRLKVSDTGCGMDENTRAHIFEPFFTTKEQGKGTGMGLATVYGIVQQHHGWIEVTSEPGKGSTFEVFIPAAQVSPQAASPALVPANTQTATGGTGTILYVEDEPLIRELAQLYLEGRGYTVLLAASGPDALRVWQEHQAKIDLLLTDVVMPNGMSGWKLAEHLLRDNPNLKVIYTSGYSEELVNKEANLVTYRFLAKPYHLHELGGSVEECLAAGATLECAQPN